ncbi:hypothetical protein OAF00_01095 [bacterium]|nr:hypothetical protein [bacterium]
MRDGAVGVGSFDVEPEGSVGGCEAQMALQAGVRFHGGVARPELVSKPFDGVRDADAQGQGQGDINPNDDTDGGGMSNLNEYISGNYAFDKDDGLRLDIVERV